MAIKHKTIKKWCNSARYQTWQERAEETVQMVQGYIGMGSRKSIKAGGPE